MATLKSIPALTRSSLATGDLIYKPSAAGWSRLGVGSNQQMMWVASGLPAWASLAANGGILDSVIAATVGGVLYRDSNVNGWKTTHGLGGQCLVSGATGAIPTWGGKLCEVVYNHALSNTTFGWTNDFTASCYLFAGFNLTVAGVYLGGYHVSSGQYWMGNFVNGGTAVSTAGCFGNTGAQYWVPTHSGNTLNMTKQTLNTNSYDMLIIAFA